MTRSESDRLTRMETLLETRLDDIIDRLSKIEAHQIKQDELSADDRAELAALKNKGTGILIGVGLAGGALGASIAKLFEGLLQ